MVANERQKNGGNAANINLVSNRASIVTEESEASEPKPQLPVAQPAAIQTSGAKKAVQSNPYAN